MINENKKTILLVEDEVIIAMSEKLLLEKYGYYVLHVITGEQAVQAITDNNLLPIDLILMDIDLGSGINGSEAAEQILKHRNIPIVFLSSHTERDIVEKTESITSYGYVVKNSGIVVIDASIKMALRLYEANHNIYKSQQLLTTIINSTDDFIWAVDPDKFGLIAFNDRLANNFLKVSGIKDISGMTPEDLFPRPDFIDEWHKLYKHALAFGSYKTEYIGKTGPHVMELSFNLLKTNQSITGIAVFGKDITDRKQAEYEILYREKLLSRIMHITPNVVTITSYPDETFVDVNKNFELLFGYEKNEVIGKSFLDLNIWKNPSDREKFMNIYNDTKHIEKVKLELLSKYGDTILSIATFSLIEIDEKLLSIAILTDMTNQKQAWLNWDIIM